MDEQHSVLLAQEDVGRSCSKLKNSFVTHCTVIAVIWWLRIAISQDGYKLFVGNLPAVGAPQDKKSRCHQRTERTGRTEGAEPRIALRKSCVLCFQLMELSWSQGWVCCRMWTVGTWLELTGIGRWLQWVEQSTYVVLCFSSPCFWGDTCACHTGDVWNVTGKTGKVCSFSESLAIDVFDQNPSAVGFKAVTPRDIQSR